MFVSMTGEVMIEADRSLLTVIACLTMMMMKLTDTRYWYLVVSNEQNSVLFFVVVVTMFVLFDCQRASWELTC